MKKCRTDQINTIVKLLNKLKNDNSEHIKVSLEKNEYYYDTEEYKKSDFPLSFLIDHTLKLLDKVQFWIE